MPITISTELQEALDNPERYGVVFVTATLGENVFGFWTGPGSITYNSVLYVNAGSLLEIHDIEQNTDGSVAEMTMKFSTAPNKGITGDILESFYDEDWQFGRVVLQQGLRDPVTKAIVGTIVLFSGVIIEAPFTEATDGAYIEARVASKAIKLSESGGQYRNAATQKALDPVDTSLIGIGNLGGAVTKELRWGQT